MSDMISTAYKFTNEENSIIKKHFTSYLDWDKKTFDKIKQNIIDHLRVQQKNKCCYCKKELGFDLKEVDIEHIIPKSEYSDFTFHNKNLALSCPGCNTKKGFKPVLTHKIKRYPQTKNTFTIIHAHYDNYSDNINIQNECIYIGKTAKGCQTIMHCELFRYNKVVENAKKYQTKVSPIAELTEKIRSASDDEVVALIDLIKLKLK